MNAEEGRAKRTSLQIHHQLNRNVLHEGYDDWQLQTEGLLVVPVKGEACLVIQAKCLELVKPNFAAEMGCSQYCGRHHSCQPDWATEWAAYQPDWGHAAD